MPAKSRHMAAENARRPFQSSAEAIAEGPSMLAPGDRYR